MSRARNIDLSKSVLLIIDMQKGFDQTGLPARTTDPDGPALRLLEAWRSRGGAVIHVRHDSVQPGSVLAPSHPGNALREGFAPLSDEGLVVKSVNSAFIGTDLDLRLRRLGADAVIALGFETDKCVSTTVRMGANLGYRMIVAADACAAFDQPGLDGKIIPAAQIHAVHLATLANEFAKSLRLMRSSNSFDRRYASNVSAVRSALPRTKRAAAFAPRPPRSFLGFA